MLLSTIVILNTICGARNRDHHLCGGGAKLVEKACNPATYANGDF